MLTPALKFGRGYAVAVWTIGLMTIVALACLWLVTEADSVARILSAYMLGCGGIGTAYQGQNIVRGLPGLRPDGYRESER